MPRVTTHQASERIAEQQPFKTSGSFRAEAKPEGFAFWRENTGNLPRDYIEAINGATYVVYSYATPIAWVKDGQWVFPEVKYSITTSRHQSEARFGIQRSGLPLVILGETEERKKTRVRSSTGGGWGS